MSTLRFEPYPIPSASLGRLNPLPDIQPSCDLHAGISIDAATVTPDEARYMGKGRVNGILPYKVQDGYNRIRRNRAWRAAILENERLRAVFLPELGGRLWSLYDKHARRELLHCNPVFQPANLALRNAWFSGGVEWNVGIIGHTPFTADRLFVEQLALSDGTPILRMYQYERVRRLIYRVEAMLPDGAEQMFVRVRIDNATDRDTWVYWWSNIAVDEREDVRVLVPAERAFRYGYGGVLSKVPVPCQALEADKLQPGAARDKAQSAGGVLKLDISRTTQIPQAMDFFFDIPDGRRRFIGALGGDGYGLMQTSTDRLIGRKLFVWGMNGGGRNWQAFLSQPGSAYLEIQAGLAHTQLEHLPMAPGERIEWMEAYGPVQANPALTHGDDWTKAVEEAERALEACCPREALERMKARAARELDGVTGRMAMSGEHWARVDGALLGSAFSTAGLSFAGRLSADERGWVELARGGALPCPDPLAEPTSYQIGSEWATALAKSVAAGLSDHWYGRYQLGVMLAHAGELDRAQAEFEASLAHAASPWALSALGALAMLRGDDPAAADFRVRAVTMLPHRSLAVEAMAALNRAGRFEQTITLEGGLPRGVRSLGRVQVLLVEALIEAEKYDRALSILRGGVRLTDVREGEVKLTDLWFRLWAKRLADQRGMSVDDALLEEAMRDYPPPTALDFRMQ